MPYFYTTVISLEEGHSSWLEYYGVFQVLAGIKYFAVLWSTLEYCVVFQSILEYHDIVEYTTRVLWSTL